MTQAATGRRPVRFVIEDDDGEILYDGNNFDHAVDVIVQHGEGADDCRIIATIAGIRSPVLVSEVENAAVERLGAVHELRRTLDPHAGDPPYDSDFYEEN
jgi:hypothetical protein